MEIPDRVAIVTGGGGGVGEVIAARLASLGAVVLVVDADAAAAERVSSAIRASGGRGEAVHADLSEADSLGLIVERAEDLGGPHILVNNVGGWGSAGRQFPLALPVEWRQVLELNLAAPMELTQRCLPAMTRLGAGAVVNVSSSAARRAGAYRSPEYAAAKAGLIRFTTALGNLGRERGVRVNCVVPDWIGLDRAFVELEAMSPAERREAPVLIPPGVVADAVVDLIADDALSGRVVVIDGGEPPRLLGRDEGTGARTG
jgi:NAD(P)-dependent dehydrogenase (short-subunit alcohol dehydrogenase family)